MWIVCAQLFVLVDRACVSIPNSSHFDGTVAWETVESLRHELVVPQLLYIFYSPNDTIINYQLLVHEYTQTVPPPFFLEPSFMVLPLSKHPEDCRHYPTTFQAP